MTAESNSTVVPPVSRPANGHRPAPIREDYFATLTNPGEIARRLLESIERGAEITERAHSVAIVLLGALRASCADTASIAINVVETICETLTEAEWRYSIEAGLKRIAELAETRPAPGGHASRSANDEIATTIESAEDYACDIREAFEALERFACGIEGFEHKERSAYMTAFRSIIERGLTRSAALKDAIGSVERLVKGGAR